MTEPTDAGGGPALDRRSRLARFLQNAAMILAAPSLFYGVLGVGSTLIVWSMIELDLARPDFYMSLFAAAGASSYLVYLLRRHRALHEGRSAPGRRLPLVLNTACIACAIYVGVTRAEMLANPLLLAIILLLIVGPATSCAALLVGSPAAGARRAA